MKRDHKRLLSKSSALAGVAQWIERGLQTKGAPVLLPVGAHAWVAGQVPSWGPRERQPTLLSVCSLRVHFNEEHRPRTRKILSPVSFRIFFVLFYCLLLITNLSMKACKSRVPWQGQRGLALARWLCGLGAWSQHPKIVGLIPGQAMYRSQPMCASLSGTAN